MQVKQKWVGGMSFEPDVEEYSYEPKHLSEAEALLRYQREKSAKPDAIVVLDSLDCGHWIVRTYSTDSEKHRFYKRKLSKHLRNAFSQIIK